MDNTLVNIFPFNRGIYTTTETKWGPSFVPDMKQVAKAVEDQGLTKAEALRLRDQLFAMAGKNDWA